MKSRWNNKGFTMVELLAAIVILGLLSAFAIVSVSVVLDRAEKNHYETQEKNMIMATQSYVNDNQNVLPKEIGGQTTVKLSSLQSKKYIGDVLDRSKITCTDGYVTIFRYSKDGYSYKPYLKCKTYETGKNEYGGSGPTISLSMNKNYDKPSFSYEITTDGDGKIISYSYAIYKHGLLVRDSGSVPVSRVGSIDKKDVSLKELVPGDFKVVFTATNIYGKTSVKEIEGSIIDKDGPECGEVEPNLNEWKNAEEVTVSVGCRDTSGSGCAKEIFSQLFKDESKTNFIEISDNLGNKTSCEVNTYIDRTPPSKPTIKNPYENTWINKSYAIEVTSTDETSGIDYFQYRYPNSVISGEREWHTYENSSKAPNDTTAFKTTDFSQERGEYVEIRACDYAGNCSEATKSMIKIDKTAPTCSISRNISTPNGINGWYVSSVNMTMTKVDNLGSAETAIASPISYELTTSKTASYEGMNLTATQTDTSASGVTWVGYITDEAGNKTTCTDSIGVLKVDLTPPEVPTITNPNANSDGSIKWINADYAVTAKSKDVHSGIDYFQYSSNNSSWTNIANSSAEPNVYKTVTSNKFTTEGNYGYYVKVCDKAGNCSSSASTTIKLDKTKPSCTVTKSIASPNGSNSWYVSNVGLTLNVTDPGVSAKSSVSYELKNANSASYGGTTTGTQSDTKGITWYGFVKDEAGNTNDCNSGSFKVDTTKPTTPTISNSNNAVWVNSNYTVNAKSKDVTAGIAYFQYSTNNSSWTNISNSAADPNVEKTATSPSISAEGNYTYYIRTCDNAGNCSASTSTNVKIDKTPPTCVSSGGSNSWKNSTVTLTGTCSESSLSGCAGNVIKNYSSDTNVTNQSPGSVKDVAGNVTDCPANQTVKVDVTKPTIAFAVAPGTHDNNSGISVTSTCTDPNAGTTGSGVASHSGATAISSPTKGKSVTHTCTDVAGNTAEVSGTYNVRYYSTSSACGVSSYYSCAAAACGAKTCATSACGVKSYNSCSDQDCGVNLYKYCAHSDCGRTCSEYNTKASASVCGYTAWSGWSGVSCQFGLVNSTSSETYTLSCTWNDTLHQSCCRSRSRSVASCAHSSFGCKTYKNNSCRTAACGVYSYKICATSACGVKEYNSCANAACGYYTCATSACGVKSYKTCWHY